MQISESGSRIRGFFLGRDSPFSVDGKRMQRYNISMCTYKHTCACDGSLFGLLGSTYKKVKSERQTDIDKSRERIDDEQEERKKKVS